MKKSKEKSGNKYLLLVCLLLFSICALLAACSSPWTNEAPSLVIRFAGSSARLAYGVSGPDNISQIKVRISLTDSAGVSTNYDKDGAATVAVNDLTPGTYDLEVSLFYNNIPLASTSVNDGVTHPTSYPVTITAGVTEAKTVKVTRQFTVSSVTINSPPSTIAYDSDVPFTATVATSITGLIGGEVTWDVVSKNPSYSDIGIDNDTGELLNMSHSEDGTVLSIKATSKLDPSISSTPVSVTVDGSCTVTFNTNGGSSISGVSIHYGNKITPAPAPPTKSGYYCKFDGWYEDSGFTLPWDIANDIVYDDITLYAKWTAYNHGDTGPGGGIIYTSSPGGLTVDGVTCYYYEVPPATWYGGTGDPQLDWATASLACASCTGGGKSDWFLPSFDELNVLIVYMVSYSGNDLSSAANATYWSSTTDSSDNTKALVIPADNIGSGSIDKTYTYYVRPIRAF